MFNPMYFYESSKSNSVFDPLSLNLVCYIRSWQGVTLSGATVTGLTDLSGNGNDFLTTGSPQIVASGINGVQSIRFNGGNRAYRQLAMIGLSNTAKRAGWIVFKLENVAGTTYHSIVLMGAESYLLTGLASEQIYSPNSTFNFIHNFNTTSLNSTSVYDQLSSAFAIFTKNAADSSLDFNNVISTGTGTQNIDNRGVYIGQWNGRGAKMLFCEYGLIDNDTNVLSALDLFNLKRYFKAKYNINPLVSIINSGIGGNNTSDVIARLSTINGYNADLAILMIGTNDWRHPTLSQRKTPTEYQTNLTTIIQSLKAAGSQVLVMSFPPILNAEADYVCPFYGLPSGCDADATGDQFRVKVPLVATAENVHYLDMWQEWENISQPTTLASSYSENVANSGTADGVHPRPNGALFIAQVVNNYLIANSLNPTSIVCVGDSITAGDGLVGVNTSTGETYPAQLKILRN